MKLLKKIETNDRGMDITIYGTALILFLFISFCSMFDLWILTFSKEQVISKLQSYSFAALASQIDYNDTGFIQDFKQHFDDTYSSNKVEDKFEELFREGIQTSSGFIYDVTPSRNLRCYVDDGAGRIKNAIYLDTGEVYFKVHKLLKASNRVPFVGGSATSYQNEQVYSRAICLVRFIYN